MTTHLIPVQIPEGETCDNLERAFDKPCSFFEHDWSHCMNPERPPGEQPRQGLRPQWCRDKYDRRTQGNGKEET
jgi:hypothetical protein